MAFPLIVSFYTPDPVYSGCAEVLRQSLDNFDLEYEIDCFQPPLNPTYQKICQYKAIFIKAKMIRHPDRNIVWLDADSELVEYPGLLNNINTDIASVLWADKQLLISILYCANNAKVNNLIDKWISINNDNYGDRNADQANLEKLLNESPDISFLKLSESYAYVPNETKGVESPVIIQYLASRTKQGYDVYGQEK